MRSTERSLSARGRGSRVVVTVMLWVMGADPVCGGVVLEGEGCWARAVLRQRRLRKRAGWIFMVASLNHHPLEPA